MKIVLLKACTDHEDRARCKSCMGYKNHVRHKSYESYKQKRSKTPG